MSKKPASRKDPGTPAAATPDSRQDEVSTPLTPAQVGTAIGEDADPELDVAPNLGGEENMQDS